MSVKIMGETLSIQHLTAYGSLTDLFHIGNLQRLRCGDKPAQVASFLSAEKTKKYIIAAEKAWDLNKPIVKVTGKGNSRKTTAHLSLLIYAAEYLNPDFHAHVIKTFVEDRILQSRDESGDEYSILNHYIDLYLPGREGKPSNRGIFINCAKLLKGKITPDGDSWNTASAQQLRDRVGLEASLSQMLKVGVIKDWDHMKEVIGRM